MGSIRQHYINKWRYRKNLADTTYCGGIPAVSLPALKAEVSIIHCLYYKYQLSLGCQLHNTSIIRRRLGLCAAK